MKRAALKIVASLSSLNPMDGKATLEPSRQELLEDLLSMSSRQTRLLEEIRDLLAAAQTSPPGPRPPGLHENRD